MVNTFLPYPCFERSAHVLDRQRLNSQKNECNLILGTLLGWPTKEGKERTGWKNHPAVRMWRGYEDALKSYMNSMIIEWRRRGYQTGFEVWILGSPPVMPWWLGDERVHAGFRQTLLFKLPEHYGKFGWKEEPKYEYWWPVNIDFSRKEA